MNEEKDKKEIADPKKLAVELFIRDNVLLFIYKKTEKISAAVYLLSDKMPDSEPLKRAFKNKCLNLVGEALSFCLVSQEKGEGAKAALVGSLLEIDSLFRMAAAAGVVSEMNSAVLGREISALGEILRSSGAFSKNSSDNIILSDNFFFSGDLVEKDKFESGFYKGQDIVKDKYNNVLYSHLKDKNIRAVKNKTSGRKRNIVKNEERRRAIVEILKKQKFVTVKDAVKAIKNCGEKTLQRELIAMVKDNILRREGDRRWSRYCLK